MYKQIVLPYEYKALEPHIDALTMETHYSKHHATYTKNLNDAVEKLGKEGADIVALLSSLDEIEDAALRTAVRNNGGGFYNHNLYFSIMAPSGGGEPDGAFGELFNKHFGSFSAFQEHITKLAVGQFGSGWAWLNASADGKLSVSSSPNQDNPLMEENEWTPILGIDVWEHAYYLKYKNLRPDYVKAFFNVIDWKAVADNYEKILSGK